MRKTFEPRHAKTCLMTYVNNKGADQTAHRHSLISTFLFATLRAGYPILLNREFQ